MTNDIHNPEEWREMREEAEASLAELRRLSPDHAEKVHRWLQAVTSRMRVLASKDLMTATAFDIISLMAAVSASLTGFNTGPGARALEIAAAAAKLEVVEAEDRSHRKSTWRENLPLLLGSNGAIAILAAALATAITNYFGGS